jgi:hypothetical protein
MKFALRCGVGNSMRAVRSQIGRFGRLLTDTVADEVLRGLQSAPSAATTPPDSTCFHSADCASPPNGWGRYGPWPQRSASGAGAQNP